MYHRIIARLDIKGPNLVKGIHLEGLRVLGKPNVFAEKYYLDGIDELLFVDVVASLYGRNSLLDIIEETSKNIFIPLTVGGGIRTIEDIFNVLRAGADKVSINTAAILNPGLITDASRRFGSSTIVISIEAIKNLDGKYYCYTDNGREETGKEVVEWAKEVEKLGAGEIILTSVDREGTGMGFDLKLIESVTSVVKIPVVAHGGFGKVIDAKNAIEIGASGITVASALHYGQLKKVKISDFVDEGNLEFLNSGTISKKITPITIKQLKEYLHNEGIECRE